MLYFIPEIIAEILGIADRDIEYSPSYNIAQPWHFFGMPAMHYWKLRKGAL
jgi:hypothetical protein